MKEEFKQIETLEHLKVKRMFEEQNKNVKKEQTAQDIINEVSLNNTSNPSYWRATKPLSQRSYYNYAFQKKEGVLK